MRWHSIARSSLLFVGACMAVTPGSENKDLNERSSPGSRIDHGTLAFGQSSGATDPLNGATFSATDQSHAWTFEVSRSAYVSVSTAASNARLDTVLYLFRGSSEGDWGRYIDRNDDTGGTLLSAITRRPLGAGRYQVLVQGYSGLERGPFELAAACSGLGCPPNDGFVVPPETQFSDRCEEALLRSVGSRILSRETGSVSPAARGGYPRAVVVATMAYAGTSDWRQFADDPNTFKFDFELYELEQGALVVMADGADESTTDYVFDHEGNLIASSMHNQTPVITYFCAHADEAFRLPPPDECVQTWVRHGPQDGESLSEGRATWRPGSDNLDLPELARSSATHYRDTVLDGEEIAIDIEWTTWESIRRGTTTELILRTNRPEMQFVVVHPQAGDPVIVFEAGEMVCEHGELH